MRERRTAARVDHFVREGEVIRGTLFGELPTKSNQRKVYKLTSGRRIFGKSEKALSLVERVGIVAGYSNIKEPLVGATSLKDCAKGIKLLYLKAVVFGDSFQRDLDVELLPDALQHAGLINNDRAIREKFYWWRLDRESPRVEFEVGYIE